MKGANDVVLIQLIDDMVPRIASTEEEADKGEVVRVDFRVLREGSLVILLEAEREEGDVEVEFPSVGEPEFVEWNDGS